ncbi:MAG: hypothetical protein CML67_01990 [Rhodobacteraceae bacterium]|nr:hypothetical protein [Paracoccaceae bacterium]
MKLLGAVLGAIILSGCAYKAEPLTAAAHNVPLSYSTKISGKWLLFVDGERFKDTVRSSGTNCAAHRFPIDLSSVYKSSVNQTLANVFSEVEMVDAPVPADQLSARGARGMVVVRGEYLRSRLDVVPGFWSANIRTNLSLTSAVTVDGRKGRLFGQTVEGSGTSDMEAGFACEGGAKSLTAAASDAMRDNVRRVAEGIGNSPRVR